MSSKLLVSAVLVLFICHLGGSARRRQKRQTVDDRPSCGAGATPSSKAVDTTAILAAIREELGNVPGGAVHAYIVPSEDAHQSEYPPAYDLRRGYISGFSGSAGTAVILQNKAALWTDGRYHQEAEETLDCNWILMKDDLPETPSISDWLVQELGATTGARVGANPFLIKANSWASYKDKFVKKGITMVEVAEDLVDNIWVTDRPAKPDTTINALPVKYAGKTWQDKVGDIRSQLDEKDVSAYVVTSLDETAWLFNARADDVDYNPFFISYAIVEKNKVSLFLLNHTRKLSEDSNDPATTVKLHEHLNTGTDGKCSSTEMCVEVSEYNPSAVIAAVTAIADANSDNVVWVSLLCNQAIYSAIPDAQRMHDKSGVALMKAMKNEVEREGMKKANIRDAAALITFVEKLEREVKEGKRWTEVTAAQDLKQHRLDADLNRGLSFSSISAVGSNGAIIHYRPANATDRQITTTDMYLLDSGGQYLDGTTDVTRTFHFGTPSDFQKDCYTRVLMGQINLAMLKWPKGLYGREIDSIPRASLWEAGLRYIHGTGHGIGAFLSVHEGPARISLIHPLNPGDQPLAEYMHFSDEPGYYETGEFGIRLENLVMVDKVEKKHQHEFLQLKTITFVPYETNLIKTELLDTKQIKWLNQYNEQVVKALKPVLSDQAFKWVERRTKPIVPTDTETCGSSRVNIQIISTVIVMMLGILKLN